MKNTDMRKLMNLVESASLLSEARHHRTLEDSINAVTKLLPSWFTFNTKQHDVEMNVYRQFVRSFETKVPKKWMTFVVEYAIAHLYCKYSTIGRDSNKIKDIADIKKRKFADFKRVVNYEFEDSRIITKLLHFSGINYAPIQNANPEEHRKEGFLKYLESKEEEFKTNASQTFKSSQSDYTTVISFPDGFAWVLLDRESCTIEGDAMGHCGNAGSPKEGDRILSLRKITKLADDGMEEHRPSLTFIINKGILGEMKGRANNKPNKKYHPYIVELLKHKSVKGIDGGGYKPENNFSILDLTVEQIADVSTTSNIPKSYLDVVTAIKTVTKASNAVLVKTIDAIIRNPDDYVDLADHIQDITSIVDMTTSTLSEDEIYKFGRKRKITNKKFYAPLVNTSRAWDVAMFILKSRWPEAEDAILTDTNNAAVYATYMPNKRWPELEEKILAEKDIHSGIAYSGGRGRWPEFEKLLLTVKNQSDVLMYMRRTFAEGERWIEAEPRIATDAHVAILYAGTYMKSRFPEAERVIANSSDYDANTYISLFDTPVSDEFKDIIKNRLKVVLYYTEFTRKRFPEAEPYILKSSSYTKEYIDYVIRGEWPEAVKTIMSSVVKGSDADSTDHNMLLSGYMERFLESPNKDFEKALIKYNDKQLLARYNEKFGTNLK